MAISPAVVVLSILLILAIGGAGVLYWHFTKKNTQNDSVITANTNLPNKQTSFLATGPSGETLKGSFVPVNASQGYIYNIGGEAQYTYRPSVSSKESAVCTLGMSKEAQDFITKTLKLKTVPQNIIFSGKKGIISSGDESSLVHFKLI